MKRGRKRHVNQRLGKKGEFCRRTGVGKIDLLCSGNEEGAKLLTPDLMRRLTDALRKTGPTLVPHVAYIFDGQKK